MHAYVKYGLAAAAFVAVVVDHHQRTDPRRRQILQGGRSDAARANHHDPRCLQRGLPRTADFAQDEVAGIAIEFGVGKGHSVQSNSSTARYQLPALTKRGTRLPRA